MKLTIFCRFAPGTALSILTAIALCFTGIQAAPPDKESRALDQRRFERQQAFMEQQQPAESLQRIAATSCVDGFAGIYPCSNIDLLAFLPLGQIGGGNGNDIWGWTDPQNGKEYAIMGRTSGTSFVDISDPENPVYLGNLPPHGANSSWRDVKVYSDHAYIVSEAFNHGMQVFDLTRLRTVSSPPVTFTETAHYDDFGNAHNLAINEDTGFAYAVGTGTCSGGPHFIDLQNPAAPVYAGCHIETVYTHDAQCVVYAGPDALYQGREICFNSNENKVNVIDVTDHANPILVSQTLYSGTGYTHQGWLTEDHVYWLQGDELDEQNFGHNTRTRILDVTDLDAPVLIGSYDGPTTAIDHNLYTLGGYVYEANYREGLRILDPVDIAAGNLTEVAYFDVYPSSDSANFNGAWSVYPFFDSGNVVVSGIEQGLFILRPLLAPDFQLRVADSQLEVCDPGNAATTVDLLDRNGYTGSVTLSVSGLPAGASELFSANPVTVPGTSDLTLSTSGVAPGSYALTVSGNDGSSTHDRVLTVRISDAFPGQPAPMSPADGAVDQSRTPTLEWAATAQASTYTVDVSTDPGFGVIVHSATTALTTHAVSTSLAPLTVHYWRVRADNSCGAGVDSVVSSFTTLDIPAILVVDDDDNSPDVRASYTTALAALGEDFDVWDTANSDNEPSVDALGPYRTVIWFAGDEFGGAAGPGGGGESALASWLDGSRCLLLSGQDYFYDRGLTGFMQSHLGVSSATSDVGQTTADGRGAVFGGLGPYTLSFPYSNYTDTLIPDATAEPAFFGSSNMGIDKDTSVYRTTFWGFGLETLPDTASRQAVLGTFLAWCNELATIDADSDGEANGSDCAPADPDLWAPPSSARDLFVTTASADNVTWQAPATPGGVATNFDVLRSEDPSTFGAAACIASGGSGLVASDAENPTSGNLFSYLIRARNGCGATLGEDSAALPRSGSTCP